MPTPKFDIRSPFNLDACWGCPVQGVCAAGKVVEEVNDVMTDETAAVLGSGSQQLLEALSGPEDEFNILLENGTKAIRSARARYEHVNVALANLLHGIIVAQNVEASRALPRDPIYNELREVFEDAPLPPSTISLEPDDMQGIADAVIHYSEIGICGAIDIEKI